MARAFSELTEREILALAITAEEEDGRTYGDFAEAFRGNYPGTAKIFEQMQHEEEGHRHALFETYRKRFGEHIPLIRREDIKGFSGRKPVWLMKAISIDHAGKQAEMMEAETRRFYEAAARKATDAGIRQLLGDLAIAEQAHSAAAERMEKDFVPTDVKAEEAKTQRRLFVLQVVQPGLAGLMDGSVSTLAPLFAAAFATQSTRDALVVGFAASFGAGISMGFAEALSDDGSLSGRGRPWIRGVICGLMTTIGGVGHTLPFLIPNFHIAMAVATGIVMAELLAISWIRAKYMDTPLLQAAFQVIVGGLLVFGTGLLIGWLGGPAAAG